MWSLIKDVHSGPLTGKKVIRVCSLWYLIVFSALTLSFVLFNAIYPIFTGEWFFLSVRGNAIGLLGTLICLPAVIGLYATED